MRKDIILENENIILKPLCEVSESISDQHIVDIANDYDIAKYVGHLFPNPYTLESSKSFKEYAVTAWEKETELVVRKIEACVFEGNMASEKVLEKNGYKKEGLRRKKHMLRDGTILDDTCYGLLKEDFEKSI